jgi:hypothetical protein
VKVLPLTFVLAAVLASVRGSAHGDDDSASHSATSAVNRCTRGLDHAANSDLPRAALYLDGCDKLALPEELADRVRRVRADVAARLEKSKLSAMSIVTTPEGLIAETTALPGERFTTPATIWAKAGDYTVNVALDAVALDAGKGMTTSTTLEAFSRRTVIINLPGKPAAPRDGKLDFTEDVPEQTAREGPPPAVKHDTMMPRKYLRPEGGGGIQLDDPFATRQDPSLHWRLGARVSGGVFTHAAADTGAALAVSVLASRPLARRVSLATRLSYAHRDVDAIGLEVGAGIGVASTRTLAVAISGAMRGEVRVQDQLAMAPVARVGIGAAAGVELALLQLPLVVGLRVEPSFTELVPGARNHTALVELGWSFR